MATAAVGHTGKEEGSGYTAKSDEHLFDEHVWGELRAGKRETGLLNA